jgi:hypothetical protein
VDLRAARILVAANSIVWVRETVTNPITPVAGESLPGIAKASTVEIERRQHK